MKKLIILPKHEQLFVKYLRHWHGDHFGSNQLADCPIYLELQKYDQGNSTLEKLIKEFMDVDGDVESWTIFLNGIALQDNI